jgi:hypothetical protein
MYLIVQHDKREVDPMIEIEYREDISHTVLITGITEIHEFQNFRLFIQWNCVYGVNLTPQHDMREVDPVIETRKYMHIFSN